MASNLFYKDKQVIGLDINQTGLKVMSIDPKKWLVEGYGSIDVDPAKMQKALEKPEEDNSYISDNINILLKEKIIGDLSSNHVVIGVPTNRTFSRTFTLPVKQEKNLAAAVEMEVSQYIPIPIEALYVSYDIIDRNKDSLEIIMAAVPKNLVDSCLDGVKLAGLRPIAVEPSINAVARILEATEEAHLSSLIIDIGQANTDIAVHDKGAIRVSGGVGIGGNTFTIDIAKKLNIALDNAHQLKVINGLLPSPKQDKITKAMAPNLLRVATEIRKVIRYYNERIENASKIEQALVVGAGSNVPGIGEFFTNELVTPVRVASPWLKLDFGKLEAPHKQFRSRFIGVAGLASIDYRKLW